jgi:hypothetical protein
MSLTVFLPMSVGKQKESFPSFWRKGATFGKDKIGSRGAMALVKKPAVKVSGHLCGRQAKSQRELIRQ